MISEYNCQIIVCLNRDYLKESSLYFPSDKEQTKTIEFESLKFAVSVVKSLYENENDENNVIIEKEYEIIETNVRASLLLRILGLYFLYFFSSL